MSIGSLSLLRPLARKRASSDAASVPEESYIRENGAESNRLESSGHEEGERAGKKAKERVNIVRPSKEVADHELLKRFQDGDEDGYVELYLRRQAEVYTFCIRLAQGDSDLASDLFQDTFLKVYRKAHTFHEGTNVLGWLYTIVRTTFLNHKRKRTFVTLDQGHENIATSDRSMHPEFHHEQKTIRERVEHAIARLPIEIREPFMLREFDGFSYQEISDHLSITLGAVRQRIYRAKQAMREELWDLVQDDPTLIPEDDRP
jgi:RNA polymerase sigma-70 factor (ECF subfamily)